MKAEALRFIKCLINVAVRLKVQSEASYYLIKCYPALKVCSEIFAKGFQILSTATATDPLASYKTNSLTKNGGGGG